MLGGLSDPTIIIKAPKLVGAVENVLSPAIMPMLRAIEHQGDMEMEFFLFSFSIFHHIRS